jgi:uncharacterized protein YwgA
VAFFWRTHHSREGGITINKDDWLLLAIGSQIQPIQIQKTLFKFSKEARVPSREQFAFRPHMWGPYSSELSAEIGRLREAGLVESHPTGRGWDTYSLTDMGIERAQSLRRVASEALSNLDNIREWVTSRQFAKLLKDVYTDYPTYATQSVFTE